ncbi:serine hydroxymethyltransferase [Mesorhizobium sp. M0488]|uniref:serine hydroxymethyltransferase n=1 Tax=unclassified Mesorhizobium TaxID=325217 RepID=UPI00333BAD33
MAAHSDRLRILGLCAHADLTVCELAEIMGVCRERVARHVRLLARADCLCCNEQAPWRSYHLKAESNDGGLVRLLVDLLPHRDGYHKQDLQRPLPEGGHLTHGWAVNFSGTDYQRVPYGLDEKTQQIDYDRLRETAKRERPRLIWVGGTAYPRVFDYAAMAEIALEANSYLVADIAHISGLIAAGAHPNPVGHCDVVSSTSHKSIRGPRGGFILSRNEDRYQALYHTKSKYNLARRIDRSVFPHLQGGPHMNAIAALAVALHEAANPSFRSYGQQTVKNAKALAHALLERGYDLVTGGTDNHMLILDLRDRPLSGKAYAERLAKAGIITNFNMVPGDHRDPAVTSGIRLGAPAVTSMGMRDVEMVQIAGFIDSVLQRPEDEDLHACVRRDVADLCAAFEVPGISDK